MKLSFVNNLNKLVKFRNSGENITNNNNEKVKLIIIDANDETVQKKTEKVIV